MAKMKLKNEREEEREPMGERGPTGGHLACLFLFHVSASNVLPPSISSLSLFSRSFFVAQSIIKKVKPSNSNESDKKKGVLGRGRLNFVDERKSSRRLSG